jgi:hypothetical protein
MPADAGPDGDEDGIEAAGRLFGQHVLDLVAGDDVDAEGRDPADLAHQIGARQPVGRDAEMHHAAGHRPRLMDLDRMAEPCEVISGRQPARPGADDQHAFAARRGCDRERPAFHGGEVAEEALDRVDADRSVEHAAIARGFARMIADPPMRRRQRIVLHQRRPGLAVLARLRQIEPGLDVLPGRAGVVAGREQIDIDRAPRAHRTRSLLAGQIDRRRHAASCWNSP